MKALEVLLVHGRIENVDSEGARVMKKEEEKRSRLKKKILKYPPEVD